ncbi:MAG: hypothetical protein Q8P67_23375 [archaeon]|nr:hypothetical protein [archaeon]
MATELASSTPADVTPLSPDDAAYIQGALDCYEAGSATTALKQALSLVVAESARFTPMPLSDQVAEKPNEGDDEEEPGHNDQTTMLFEALETLQDQFEDLNRTAILTHNPAAHFSPLLRLFDHPIARVRVLAVAAAAASWHSNLPLQTLAQNAELGYQLLPDLLTRIAAFTQDVGAHHRMVLALLSALSGLVANNHTNASTLVAKHLGFLHLLPLLDCANPRIRAKVLFLVRNLLKLGRIQPPQEGLPSVSVGDYVVAERSHIPLQFLGSTIGQGSVTLAELTASCLDLLSGFLQDAIAAACPDIADKISARLDEALHSEDAEDFAEEIEALKRLQTRF